MLNQTRQKLDEARFFLGQLKKNRGKERKFDFYLSAFISSARSVTWVMRKEYAHVSGWEAWYDAKEKTRTEEEQALLDGTNKMRIQTEKLGSLETSLSYIINVPKVDLKKIKRKPKGKIALRLSGTVSNCMVEVITEEGRRITYPSRKVIAIRREVAEFPAKDVLNVCETYCNHLEKLLEECNRKFDVSR